MIALQRTIKTILENRQEEKAFFDRNQKTKIERKANIKEHKSKQIKICRKEERKGKYGEKNVLFSM